MPAKGMAPLTYTAVCERVGKWWEITVPELPAGRVTQARDLDDVGAMVKDLVALMTGVCPENVNVHVKVIEPPRAPAGDAAGQVETRA